MSELLVSGDVVLCSAAAPPLRDAAVLVQPGYFFDLRLGATLVVSLLPPPADFDHGVACLLAGLPNG